MSDILSSIDDTLADWHGSADSMRWTAEEQPVTAAGYLRGLQEVLGRTTDVSPPRERINPTWRLDPAVWPHRDRVLDLSWIALRPGMLVQVYGGTSLELLRIIEGPEFGPWRVRPVPERPKRLDARYRQRQRNRRKRRR